MLHPGGVPIVRCTSSEWDLTSTAGDRIANLPAQFGNLSADGERLALWPTKLIPSPRYTSTPANALGRDNHFQGIQRLRLPGVAVISGGDPHTPMAHLFVVALPSRGAAAEWGSNLAEQTLPPLDDKVVLRLDLNATLWHAGGMALLGDVLAIPVENSDGGGSRIEFLNLRDPRRPTDLGSGISRPGAKAGAVALTRLPDGRYLAAVWSDSESAAPSKHLDFYRSNLPTLLAATWSGPNCVTDPVQGLPSFQTIALLWDTAANGSERRLYLAGFENAKDIAPDPEGPNRGELHEVTLPDDQDDNGSGFGLREEAVKIFTCLPNFADMDAGTGIFRSEAGVLAVYCVYHHIMRGPKNQMLARFQEYFSRPENGEDTPVTSLAHSRVELFDQAGLGGAPLLLTGGALEIPDLDAANIRGAPIPRRASSLRVRLPDGFALVLYRETRKKGKRPLGVRGTGATVEVPRLADHDFENLARSCSVVARRVAEELEGIRFVN